MADGIIMEKRGVPSASVTTDAFTSSGGAMARARGIPGYKFAMMPHPLSSLTPEQVRQAAIDALPQILEILGLDEEGQVK